MKILRFTTAYKIVEKRSIDRVVVTNKEYINTEMVRNLSLKADDVLDDKLYSVSKKKGMSKSEYIRNEVEKAIDRETSKTYNPDLRELPSEQLDSRFSDNNILDELVNSNVNLVEGKAEKKSSARSSSIDMRATGQSGTKLENSELAEAIEKKTEETTEQKNKESIRSKEFKELKDLKDIKNELNSDIRKGVSINQSSNLVVGKEHNKGRLRPKFVIGKKVNRVNDQEGYNLNPAEIEDRAERAARKIIQQNKFNETFDEMNSKINNVCEDGKCLKADVDLIKGKIDKIDSICEDGKCLRSDVGDIKKELTELKEFKKSFDEIRGGIGDIKGGFESLNKKTLKKELCPQCGWGIEEGSSYCPNCSLEIKEWLDEHGNKLDWEPYSRRKTNK